VVTVDEAPSIGSGLTGTALPLQATRRSAVMIKMGVRK